MSEARAPWDEEPTSTSWDQLPSVNEASKAKSPPIRFADAYAELQSIAAQLKPSAGSVPDVDLLEPLIKRANELVAFCQARIEAVRILVEEERGG